MPTFFATTRFRAALRRRLADLVLDRRETRAWALYDWANSAFMTSVVAGLFPIFFTRYAAQGLEPGQATRILALLTTGILAVVAVATPVMGAIADHSGRRKRYLAGFLALGVAATAGLAAVGEGDWAAAVGLFALANLGAYGSFVFYDSLLPHLVAPRDLARLSAAGYALGYLGGGLLLALQIVWILRPEILGLDGVASAVRLAFASVAVWWLVFAVPLLLYVPEPPVGEGGFARKASLRAGLRRLGETIRALRTHRETFLFLLAFLIYSDGIGTVIRLSVAYASEIGLGPGALLGGLLVVQLVGVPFTFAFARLAEGVGTKRAIGVGLAGYTLACLLGSVMQTAAHFFVLAALIGVVQGGTQSLGRALFARLAPRERSAEFFAFFAVSERFAGVMGPLLFAAVGHVTGSNRIAILSLVAMFVIGAGILSRVQVDEQHAPRDGDGLARDGAADQSIGS